MNLKINKKLVQKCLEKGYTISAMESCTGGYFASSITDVSGSSEIFSESIVTYSNDAKIRNGVSATIIENYGVYSTETACNMANALFEKYHTTICVGITGSMGRIDPNNSDSVVGEVYYGIRVLEHCFHGKIQIPSSITSRNKMKEYVVDKIQKVIYDYIQ